MSAPSFDAALLEDASLRTVAARHGLSADAVHRHRMSHVDGCRSRSPTLPT